MSLVERDAYPIADPVSALRYASARAEHANGRWVYVRTGQEYRLRCAWRVTEDGHELEVGRRDHAPDEGDLYVIRQALNKSRLVEIAEPIPVPSRNVVVLLLEKRPG